MKAADAKFVFDRAINPETKHPAIKQCEVIADIIVTDESAKKMSQPPSKSTGASGKKGAATAPDQASTPAASSTPATSDASSDNKQIRTVGPTIIPPRQ